MIPDGPPTPLPYTLSLHDALPISRTPSGPRLDGIAAAATSCTDSSCNTSSSLRATCTSGKRERNASTFLGSGSRSEEHTSELQSRGHLVCRLLLEKKKTGCLTCIT